MSKPPPNDGHIIEDGEETLACETCKTSKERTDNEDKKKFSIDDESIESSKEKGHFTVCCMAVKHC